VHGIVTLKNRTLAPVAKLFIDSVRESAKLLGKNGARKSGRRRRRP
jgi:hypothetical protein